MAEQYFILPSLPQRLLTLQPTLPFHHTSHSNLSPTSLFYFVSFSNPNIPCLISLFYPSPSFPLNLITLSNPTFPSLISLSYLFSILSYFSLTTLSNPSLLLRLSLILTSSLLSLLTALSRPSHSFGSLFCHFSSPVSYSSSSVSPSFPFSLHHIVTFVSFVSFKLYRLSRFRDICLIYSLKKQMQQSI